MLPIFVLGIIMGIVATTVYCVYKEDTPSQINLQTKERIIENLREDIRLLESTNKKLIEEITELKKEANK